MSFYSQGQVCYLSAIEICSAEKIVFQPNNSNCPHNYKVVHKVDGDGGYGERTVGVGILGEPSHPKSSMPVTAACEGAAQHKLPLLSSASNST